VTLPLRVTVAPERADAAPGDHLQFDVTVRNASDIVEHYGVEMLGLPQGATVRVEPEVAKLRPAESATLTVKVNLPVQPPAPAGTYVAGALVRSPYRHDVSRCVEVPIQLASVEQITIRTSPEVVTGGRSGQYTIEVANGGNAPVRLYLAATDPERRVTATFQPPWLDLPPGTNGRALLSVSAPLPWNREKQRQLTVTASPDMPGAVPATSNASFVQQPRFASKFAKVAGIAAGVMALAAAIAVPALITKANEKKETPAAATQTPAAPATAAQQPSSAAPPPSTAPPSTAPPSTAPPSTAPPSTAPTDNGTNGGGTNVRDVDLTKPKDGVLASDAFRDDGFLVSADPGAVAVTGCTEARSAAVVTDPGTGLRFLTASLADDATKCHEVPVLIDFPTDGMPAGLKVTPVTPNTLQMEVVFGNLKRQTFTDLLVPADLGKANNGIDQVRILPVPVAAGTATPPVALTRLTIAPLG
jgi:hypothetical protein